MKNFSGVFTALITPFKNGEVDYESFKKLVKFQCDNGVKGFVVNGTTAESPTLSWDEVENLFKTAKQQAPAGTIFVIGTGSNSTKDTVDKTKKAKELGADGALVVCPYYNKPMPAGIKQHFLAVADSVELPIILYNVPGRTITEIPSELVVELSGHKNIVAVKEATGNIPQGEDIANKTDDNFVVTSGDDGSCLGLALKGGQGVISVMSHVIPKQTVEWMARAINKDEAVLSDYEKYDSFVNSLYIESNPIPVKMALKLMGIIESAELRLPMTEMSAEGTTKLTTEMKSVGLI